MIRPVEYRVTAADEGEKLEHILRHRLGASGSLVRSLKRVPDGIRVNGVHAITTLRVRQGDLVTILADCGRPSLNVQAERGSLDIVFEDQDLLVVDKPAGLAVHPSPGHPGGTLANRVSGYLGQAGEPFVFRAIGRLDKGTSGLLCIAKNRLSAERLGEALECREIRRVYLAVLCGTGLPPEGVVDLPIGRREGYGIMRQVRPDGAPSVTHYRVLREAAGYTLAQIRLETGRTHQIRVHLSHLGHPVAGDFMYGQELPGREGHALHSHCLSLTHPVTGREMTWRSPLPGCWEALLDG